LALLSGSEVYTSNAQKKTALSLPPGLLIGGPPKRGVIGILVADFMHFLPV